MLRNLHRVRAPCSIGPSVGAEFARLVKVFTSRTFSSPLVRRFIKQDAAGTTIEFALLAAPFLAGLFAILQTALVFFAGQTLETAAATSARLIFTGQAQTHGWTAAQFKSQVCNQIQGIFNCNNGVYVDVETYSSFAAVNLGMPIIERHLQHRERSATIPAVRATS